MKIFVIGGKAESGKTTFGNYLKEYLKDYGYKPCVMHITDPLYQYAEKYFDWNRYTDQKPREFLQKMGIEVIQQKMGKRDFLLNRLYEDIDILSNFFDTFIITDARLVHEFESIRDHFDDVVTIKLARKHKNSLSIDENNHITEKDLDNYNYFDYIVINTSLSDLNSSALDIVKREEEL